MSTEDKQKTVKNVTEGSQSTVRIILHDEEDTISLKQLVIEDADPYFQLVDSDRAHLSQPGDETASKYPTVESVRESVIKTNSKNPPEKYRFGIWDGDLMVGSDNLMPADSNRAELGSWIGKKYIGNRYAGRARRLLVDFAFNQLHLDEVFCEITIGNESSQKSVERSGFEYKGEHEGKWSYILTRPKK
jgi:RimJ/RimL family protein N-acetyltransferase